MTLALPELATPTSVNCGWAKRMQEPTSASMICNASCALIDCNPKVLFALTYEPHTSAC